MRVPVNLLKMIFYRKYGALFPNNLLVLIAAGYINHDLVAICKAL